MVGVVIALTVVESNINGGIEGSIISSVGVEGDDGTENGVGLAELVLQSNGKAILGGTSNALDSEVLVNVSSKMRITVNQTESSVLGLGGIPISLGESLQS